MDIASTPKLTTEVAPSTQSGELAPKKPGESTVTVDAVQRAAKAAPTKTDKRLDELMKVIERAQARAEMTRETRWKLVGLETEDGSVLPDGAYIPAEGTNANGQRNTQGRVTSTYFSPTLNRGIAMGLVAHGPDRMGEVVEVGRIGAEPVRAKIVTPCVYDKEGTKQDV